MRSCGVAYAYGDHGKPVRGRTSHRTPAFEVRMPGSEEFTVWGFTAILLDRIFDSLGWTVPWDTKKMRPAPGYEE